jgi:hypothetical protein
MGGEGLAARYMQLFAGRRTTHGEKTYPTGRTGRNGKAEGYAKTIAEPVTVELWERHLDGDGGFGLGVVPVDEEGMCRWGALDVDVYNLDHRALVERIAKLKMPLLVARSQSGGAHLLIFMTEPRPAADVRAALEGAAETLGYRGSEIFPKQDSVEDGGFGSWLSMPYQGGERSLRYVFDPDTANPLAVTELADVAYDRAATADDLALLAAGPGSVDPTPGAAPDDDRDAGGAFPDGPPCLNQIVREWADGSKPEFRNEMLFNVTLYWKRADPRQAEPRSVAFARDMKDPLGEDEARRSVASALKRSYNYRCRNAPLHAHCDRHVCEGRRYGVGEQTPTGITGVLTFGDTVRYGIDPPIWIWDVNGVRVEFTTEQLMSQRMFLTKVLAETGVLGRVMRPSSWNALIAQKCANASLTLTPPEAREEGILWHNLEKYATGRVVAKSEEELFLGKPWTGRGRTFFSAPDFLTWCNNHGSKVTGAQLFRWLAKRGLAHEFRTTESGKAVSVWSVPEIRSGDQAIPVPRDSDAGEKF